MDLPRRKKIRLEGYDYSSNGMYFVTICISKKTEILWQNNVGANFVRPFKAELSETGKIVEEEIWKLDTIYENIRVDQYCIMPDHIHMIICNNSRACIGNEGTAQNGRTQFAPTLSRVIKQFKGSVTKKVGYSIWQKSFNDMIIRNEKAYKEICRYIHENPLKYLKENN